MEELALGPDDQVLVLGNSGALQGARLFGFDRCTGEQTLEMSLDHPGADETGVYDIAVDGAAVYVAGNVVVDGDDQGYLVKLEGSPLSISFTQPLAGSTGADEIFDLGVDDGGRIWLSGITQAAAGATAWIVSSDSEGQYCSFTWSGTGPSYAKGLAITGQSVGVLIENEGSLVGALYDSGNCTCDCTPDVQSQPIALGSNSSHVGAGILLDGQVYLAAYATDTDAPGNIYGVLAWIDQNGALVDTYTYDATAAGDGFIQIATDGQTLFVAGLDGWTGGSFDNAQARLEAFDVPLPANAQPLWSGAPDGLNVIPGLAAEQGGGGGLFVAGNIDGEGVIVRCDKSGNCG